MIAALPQIGTEVDPRGFTSNEMQGSSFPVGYIIKSATISKHCKENNYSSLIMQG